MALELLNPEDYAATGAASLALLGAPGAIYNEAVGLRQLTSEGLERAKITANLMTIIPTSGELILHPGYGGGYKEGGPRPTSYIETEAYAYEAAVDLALATQHGLDMKETGWEILPGEDSNGLFDPRDFSSSTAEEAFLINRTYQRLGNTGLLGIVGGPLQLRRFAETADAMQLPISDNMVGIATSGTNESNLREHLVLAAYRRTVLLGEQTTESVLIREQAFYRANTLGRLFSITLGQLRPSHSSLPGTQ